MKVPKIGFPIFIPECKPIGRQKNGRTLFKLLKDFVFYVEDRKYVVPADFVFDGASIPWGARNTFNPADTQFMAAALIHDWLYAGEICPRKLADRCFLGAMIYLRVPEAKRNFMFAAVRVGGGVVWKLHDKKEIMDTRRLSGFTTDKSPLWEVL